MWLCNAPVPALVLSCRSGALNATTVHAWKGRTGVTAYNAAADSSKGVHHKALQVMLVTPDYQPDHTLHAHTSSVVNVEGVRIPSGIAQAAA